MLITKGKKVALLFGASGLVGGHCLALLLASERYKKVIIFVRKELEIEHEKLEQYILNFKFLNENAELIKGNDLFCCLGTTLKKAVSFDNFRRIELDYVLTIAKIAEEQGVGQFLLVSAMGANEESLIFYNSVKGELENTIKQFKFWGIHIFQPSLLLGDRKEERPLEEVAIKVGKMLSDILGDFIAKYRPVEAETVALAMINAAQGITPGIFIYKNEEIPAIAEGKDQNGLENS